MILQAGEQNGTSRRQKWGNGSHGYQKGAHARQKGAHQSEKSTQMGAQRVKQIEYLKKVNLIIKNFI